VQRIYRWHERYSNAVCNLARVSASLFIDIRDVFLSERDYGRLLCADGIHPNREGHAVMERAFLDFAARHLS
jgi:lysophospholipase L1-like esterase